MYLLDVRGYVIKCDVNQITFLLFTAIFLVKKCS